MVRLSISPALVTPLKIARPFDLMNRMKVPVIGRDAKMSELRCFFRKSIFSLGVLFIVSLLGCGGGGGESAGPSGASNTDSGETEISGKA